MWKLPGHKRGQLSDQAVTTLIAPGTTVNGDVLFVGTLEVEGVINGCVRPSMDAQGVVRILPGGHVRGDVMAPIVVVNGLVTGNVYSCEHVELAAQAVVRGDVEYSLIEMTKGAQVEGRLHFRDNKLQMPQDGEALIQDSDSAMKA